MNGQPRGPSAAEISATARALILKRVVTGLVVLLLLVLVGAGAIASVLVRTQQVNNTPVLEDAATAAEAAQRGTRRIEDCTTPGRNCYERGQRQISGAVDVIGRVSVYAAACSAGVSDALSVKERVELIEACVRDLLEQRSRRQ